MSFIQNMFDPGTSAYNAKVRAANAKRMSLAMGRNVQYKNKGAAFKQAKWGAATDKSIADSNVLSKAMQNQYAAYQGFESIARARAAQGGPTGNQSRTAERGRNAGYMALLAKRQDIEHGLKETFGAAFHGQLHKNSVNQQNQVMAGRDKLGLRPAQMGLAGMKSTNWTTAAFNMAKTGISLASGLQGLGAFGVADPEKPGSGTLGALLGIT